MDNRNIDFRKDKAFSKEEIIIMIWKIYMVKKNGNKKTKVNNKNSYDRCFIRDKAYPVKIAYYVQRLLEKNIGTKEIILIISSQFGNDNVREFARMYRCCIYMEDIRNIANLIYNIPKKNMDDAMDTVLHDVLIKREIFSREYIKRHRKR